ncbi:Rieske (2Fe-2S) iron-sulfur domain protein [Allomeiothermus silvanus DSM 9946]|uniref:Rieske (2Fe-2S) iron-sulfur domain protein n=1 Tax=Allomeiothermus silvanus (strain ATCC 700542 / DSM 9946 / NBRC 106475 / NCIMB 13440 / VI-R2) TaxID=526227 RepID=D7BEB1_ALLS1|nr:Rieske 2Fe-2S domain-containing protein [Allomeiothermus silvanus]ADH64969.1 Rieske (2Fe-2S) iron-sulfur domain protein [Allomeiothermus silvanus DSM 9946]
MQEWKAQMEEADERAMPTRRAILQAAIGTSAVLAGLSVGYIGVGLLPKAIKTPENAPPQVGDILVYAIGAKMNQPIQVADLPEAGPFQLAFPMDPKTSVVRNKQLNNTLLVLKLLPGSYDPKLVAHVAEGVVCYSAICTHLGCTVSEWESKPQMMRCPCHGSVFNPRDDTVVSGPAPLPLAILPIRLEGSQIVVAGEFLGPVGAQV